MERSESAQEFLKSLDPEGLKVGDGSDHLPVWIGIDAEARRVYKIYANGLAQGFGDGGLVIVNGIPFTGWGVKNGEQLTQGRHLMLSGEDVPPTVFEASPSPTSVE